MKNFKLMHEAQVEVSAKMSFGWSEMTVSSEEMEGILMTTPTPSASATLIKSTTSGGVKMEMTEFMSRFPV